MSVKPPRDVTVLQVNVVINISTKVYIFLFYTFANLESNNMQMNFWKKIACKNFLENIPLNYFWGDPLPTYTCVF